PPPRSSAAGKFGAASSSTRAACPSRKRAITRPRLKSSLPARKRGASCDDDGAGTDRTKAPRAWCILNARSSPSLPLSVSSRSDLENAIEQIASEPNGALIVFAGPLAVAHRDLIITLAVKHSLPLLYPYRYFTAAGGLISYGPDLVDQYRLAVLRARSRPTSRSSSPPLTCSATRLLHHKWCRDILAPTRYFP